ncbi:acetylglucosamine-6-sulfatase [Labilibaculum filiforme]|uniref:Acetylglucosamine-6-sulfatase n=1 Tax=Labilibaculum filiforme TaxID=1940526 RepID=A0A2N3HUX2_9BACT|nr:sulfatase [Labilibaculum filiforme]PKQ61843.1 acetylglucosamine-6-sulfatase [Labilibaculum filiforme]
MKKIIQIIVLAVVAMSCSNTQQPNIIYIMSDDHAAHAIGAYGGRLATLDPTPNLDKLASEGMLFENCFATNSICTPSRATILTGQYSQTNGVLDLDGVLDTSKQYLPVEMKKLGYETAIIGKWHLKIEPSAFDYYSVLEGQGKYFNPEFYEKGKGKYPNNIVKTEGHSSDVITNKVISWITGRKDKKKPFFLMYHFKAPHDWFENAPRYDSYLADVKVPEPENLYSQPNWGSEGTRGRNDSLIHEIGTSVSRRHQFNGYVDHFKIDKNIPDHEATSMAYQMYLKKYLRCVKGVDDNLGNFFQFLKDNDLYKNTVIVYSADQGMMLGEHDMVDKRWMYEEATRMPFIIHYPELVKAGQRSQSIINNTDFAPTLIDLAGGKVPDKMQGKSIIPLLNGEEPADWRTGTYYRYWMHLTHHDIPAHFGIRTKDYKLIFFYGRHWDLKQEGDLSRNWLTPDRSFKVRPTPVSWELYDLNKDPHEVNNVYNNPAYSEVIKELKVELKRQREAYNETDKAYPHIQKNVDENWN